MNNRFPNPSRTAPKTFGLIAWLEQTRVTLPLKGVECYFHVCGDLLNVEIRQIFHQCNPKPVDCLYTFPLPASAAVYCCEMHVNGRTIRAKVEKRERARAIAREMKEAGHRTGLVEMERDNLFTLSLGNLQPEDVVVIRLAYFQTLTRLGDWTSFSIPFCPGIRYIPGKPLLRARKGRGSADDTDQVPDASRISPPRIQALHPDAATVHIEGTVEHPLGDVSDISSPSHPVLVRPLKEKSEIRMADVRAVPNSDFVLRWTEAQAPEVHPVGWVSQANGQSFALVRLRAPRDVPAVDAQPQDFYFLVDRSGSMNGLKWQKAVQAFREFVKGLGSGSRVWATFFADDVWNLGEKPLDRSELLADRGMERLDGLGTDGGTELVPALRHVLQAIRCHSDERPATLVLITDGLVGNETEVLRLLSAHRELRVHVFGIDSTLNDGLLRKLAAQNHGTSCLLSPNDDMAGAVKRLGERLHSPVLTSLRVEDGWETSAGAVPNLYAGEVLSVPLRGQTGKPTLKLSGTLPDGSNRTYEFGLAETQDEAFRLLWAKERIDQLLAAGRSAEALSMAKEQNIVCEGAAFIAWDETERVPVSVPDELLYQPSLRPEECSRWEPPLEGVRSVSCCIMIGGSPPRPRKSPQPFREIAHDYLEEYPQDRELIGSLLAFIELNSMGRMDGSLTFEEVLTWLRRFHDQPSWEHFEIVVKWIVTEIPDLPEDVWRAFEDFFARFFRPDQVTEALTRMRASESSEKPK